MNHDPRHGSSRTMSLPRRQFLPAQKMRHAGPNLPGQQRIRQMPPGRCLRGGGVDPEVLSLATAPFPVGLENSVGVEQIGKGQVELGEVVAPVWFQHPAPGKKSRQTGTVDRTDVVHPTGPGDKLPESRVGDHLDPRLRPLLPESGHCRKGKKKVPESAATDDEDLQIRISTRTRPAPTREAQKPTRA